MHYLHHIFNKFKSIFKYTDNLGLQVGYQTGKRGSCPRDIVRENEISGVTHVENFGACL